MYALISMNKTIQNDPIVSGPGREQRSVALTMLSVRIDNELNEYVRLAAYETRKSKQEIVAEALRLHREYYQGKKSAG